MSSRESSSSWRTRNSLQSTQGESREHFTSCLERSRPGLKRNVWQVGEYRILFCSTLGCVLPLQEVAFCRVLHLSVSFAVLVHTTPCCPTMSSLQRHFGLPTDLTPFICHYVLLIVHLFCSTLGCVLPLQEVVLCQSPPSFSVLCYPCPYNCCSTTSSLQRRFGLRLILHPLSATLCF